MPPKSQRGIIYDRKQGSLVLSPKGSEQGPVTQIRKVQTRPITVSYDQKTLEPFYLGFKKKSLRLPSADSELLDMTSINENFLGELRKTVQEPEKLSYFEKERLSLRSNERVTESMQRQQKYWRKEQMLAFCKTKDESGIWFDQKKLVSKHLRRYQRIQDMKKQGEVVHSPQLTPSGG